MVTQETGKCARSSHPLTVGVRWRWPQYLRFLHGNCPQTRCRYTDASHPTEHSAGYMYLEWWVVGLPPAAAAWLCGRSTLSTRRLVYNVHTNNTEACWSACKATFKRHYGVMHQHLPSYLNEYKTLKSMDYNVAMTFILSNNNNNNNNNVAGTATT